MTPASSITFDLTPLLVAAGFPEWRALLGAPPSEVAATAASVAADLRRWPDEYRAIDPSTSWRVTYGLVLAFLDSLAEEMRMLDDVLAEVDIAKIWARAGSSPR